ncbi:MAG TPA: glycoside hydrolase family 6 protein [Acidimicrobiales bacterium]|nr:glycoside hydrolase family 6 protein [Acidimicrobiales bacterium]
MLRRANARVVAAAIAALTGTVVATLPVSPAAADVSLEAEIMALTAGAGASYADADASAGHALLLWSNGTASATTTTGAGTQLVVRARGDFCSGAPRMDVRVDGTLVLSTDVSSTRWTDYAVSVPLPAGSHAVVIGYSNDQKTKKCDRNLRLDRVRVVEVVVAPASTTTTTTTTTAPAGPSHALESASLYVDPYSNAAREAASLRTSDPTRAALFDKVAGQSQADWVGDWIPTAELASNVNARIGTIAAAGAVPVFVSYAIPLRDCGSYSAGGIGTPDGYRAWVRELAKGIGGRKAAVILEPDALSQISCLTTVQQQERLDLLADASTTLTASGASVYIDAGHSAWVPIDTMAARLKAAGVSGARGFSLNVSNFQPTANEIAYGTGLAEHLGGKAFVVDTSRNGLGPYDGAESWCNPPGRALGGRPSTSTGVSGLDALLWVKRPGESDGTCRGGPSAGTWWPDYAAGLAERSSY